MTVRFSLVLRVGDFRKSTRHLYTPASNSDTLSMVSMAGSESVRKCDRPCSVSSFQCNLFGSVNLSRTSTLCKTIENALGEWSGKKPNSIRIRGEGREPLSHIVYRTAGVRFTDKKKTPVACRVYEIRVSSSIIRRRRSFGNGRTVKDWHGGDDGSCRQSTWTCIV